MLLERDESAVVVSPLQGVASPRIVSIFKQAFPRHPAALLTDELTCAFLCAFGQRATFLVARHALRGDELGFAVGGEATVLDRTRAQFIRGHRGRLAGSFLGQRLSVRILLARIRVRRPIHALLHAPYQLRFIAVDPQVRGAGVGAALLIAFERTLPLGGAYHAWTLEGSRGAEKFYLDNGFTRETNVNGHICMRKIMRA